MADGHIHGGGMELRSCGDKLQTSVTRTATGSDTIEVVVFVIMNAIAKFDGG